METIGQLLENSEREHGPRLALKMRSGLRLERYTYHQLWKQAQCMAGLLQDRGMEKGDRVLVWAPNSPSWVIAYLGALLGGGVAVPLDVGSTPDFAAKVATQTEPVLALLFAGRTSPETPPRRGLRAGKCDFYPNAVFGEFDKEASHDNCPSYQR